MADGKNQFELLEALLGHQFANRELLLKALTHRSVNAQTETCIAAVANNNERLEFLGDAVLGLVVGEALFNDHADWREGELTRVRAQLVSRRHLGEVAQAIGLGQYLVLHKSEDKAGLREKATVLSNCMEAVLAALYLDGGLGAVRNFARQRILAETEERLAQELSAGASLGNYKSALQELLQSERLGAPVYQLESASGPDHKKQFQVEVRLRSTAEKPGRIFAHGKGSTRKAAEQDAARHALRQIKNEMEIESATETAGGAGTQ